MLFGLLALCWISPFSKKHIPVRVLCHLKLESVPSEWFGLLWQAWSFLLVYQMADETYWATVGSVASAKACLFLVHKARVKLRVLASALCALSCCVFLSFLDLYFNLVLMAPALWFAARLFHVGAVDVPVDKTKERRIDRARINPSQDFFKKKLKR